MNKYITITLLFLAVNSSPLFSQQTAQYTHYMFNKLAINPAFAGNCESISLSALYRHQWQGVTGAPRTMHYSLHSSLLDNQVGLGLNITSDKIGFWQSNRLNTNYAYRISLGEDGQLSAGINASLTNSRYDWSETIYINEGDANIKDDTENFMQFNYGFGLYYTTSRFYIGASVPNILESVVRKQEDNVPNKGTRTYYLSTGVLVDLNDFIILKPSILISYIPNAPFEFDANLSLILLEQIILGASYRRGDSASAMVQYKLDHRLTLGVATDFTLSDLKSYSAGTLEVIMQYTPINNTRRKENCIL